MSEDDLKRIADALEIIADSLDDGGVLSRLVVAVEEGSERTVEAIQELRTTVFHKSDQITDVIINEFSELSGLGSGTGTGDAEAVKDGTKRALKELAEEAAE